MGRRGDLPFWVNWSVKGRVSAIFVVALVVFPLCAWIIGAWPELAWVEVVLFLCFGAWIAYLIIQATSRRR